ncbi:DNA repair protein [Cognatishimia sp. F0-27]|uniref:DNA repair protein n=1 Tax=Cognatishimia sp. F0-27 TaxID=2816855 RepID=UPI001D0C987B|nr:DNA repair protein [Cognatishimia sp. F0-27]MCC1493461.1 DNA repair protein [Cognatishimia sp. F0-27]
MGIPIRSLFSLLARTMQLIALAALIVLACGLMAYTIACLLGYATWVDMPLRFGETVYPDAGIWVQSGLTALIVGLCFYLPANARIMALENSHRRFHIGMQDVARAYAVAHQSDRQGAFQLRGEFDSIRERLAFLRNHPDLADLEPSVLEIAAQMSHVSQELAQTYSDRNMQRARDFLIARQEEIADFNTRIETAKSMAVEIKRWARDVEMDEAVAQAQLDRLRDDLAEIMPELLPRIEAAERDTARDTRGDMTRDKAASHEGAQSASPDAQDAPQSDSAGRNITRLPPRAAE